MKNNCIEDCYKLANLNGGKFISTEYINVHTKYLWECALLHRWWAQYANIQQGTWCPYCVGKVRLTIEDCHKLAELNNGKFLSTEYIDVVTKYFWQCKLLHQWWAQYANIQQGKWCPYCAGNAKLTIVDCYKLAEKMGGKFLSTEYINASIKYLWECSEKHQWAATYNNVQQGKWCPKCCYYRKSQSKLKEILQSIYPPYKIEYNFHGFDWLKKEKKLELDFFIPELKLAIEYDGHQHFESIKYFGGKQDFYKRKQYDFLKNKLIYQHKQDVKTFIRIPYWEQLTEKNIRNILARNLL